nr:hypothetical protein [Tanacetum cinerariifolium]
MRCGSGLSKGLCLICGNNQNSLHDSPSIFENSSQSPPHISHHCCYECGDPLDDISYKRCTCKSCGKGAHIGYNFPPKVPNISNPVPCKNQTIDELQQTLPSFHPTRYSGDESTFTCDLTPNIVDDSPNVFNPPTQPLKYSYEFCGNDAYYGHDCPPQQKKEEKGKQVAKEQATKARYWKIPVCYDNDEDYTIEITPKEPDNSLNFSKKIYSNPLFDEEIISMKIDPRHFNAGSVLIESLLSHDSSIFSSSSKIDSLLDEFAGELILLKLIPPGINETDCDPEEKIRFIKTLLYDNSSPRPPKEFISKNFDAAIKSFSPSPIPVEDSDSFMEEIDLSFTPDDPMPPGIEEDDYDFERNILILEELISNDSLSLPENTSFHFNVSSSSRPPTKPPDRNSGILNVKVMGDISEHNVPMPRLMLTQPTLVPNQEKSPNLLYHQGHKASQSSIECLMMIYRRNTPILDVLFLHFYPP